MGQVALNNGKISTHQFKVLVIVGFIGTSVLNAPGILVEKAKQDGWIAAILNTAGALILVCFYNALGEQLRNMTLVEYTKKLFGKWIGGAISFTFVLFLFLNSSALVWIVGNFMVTQLLTETPMIAIIIVFMIVIVIGSRLGIEVIGRAAEVLYPWVIGGFIILNLFILPEAQTKNLLPVFEDGIKPIVQGAALFMCFTPLTFITSLMIFPTNINEIKKGKGAFLKGILTAGSMITLLTIACIMVLGAEGTARNVYPSYVLAKKIGIGKFIERVEAVLGMVWIVTIFFKTIIYFYSTVVGVVQILEMKDYKPFTWPLGMLVVLFSQIIYPDTVYAAKWDSTTWVSYVLTYGFIYPLLLFIVGKVRHK
jgi:spore germination protein KB